MRESDELPHQEFTSRRRHEGYSLLVGSLAGCQPECADVVYGGSDVLPDNGQRVDRLVEALRRQQELDLTWTGATYAADLPELPYEGSERLLVKVEDMAEQFISINVFDEDYDACNPATPHLRATFRVRTGSGSLDELVEGELYDVTLRCAARAPSCTAQLPIPTASTPSLLARHRSRTTLNKHWPFVQNVC